MLVRRRINLVRTEFTNRQDWPNYSIEGQEVSLDPWENDDCMQCIAQAFLTTAPPDVEGWHSVPSASPSIGESFVRIAEDRQTGYIYYARPIDIERQQMWNEDRSFRVTAMEW